MKFLGTVLAALVLGLSTAYAQTVVGPVESGGLSHADLSGANITATGGTTARTAAAWFGDRINARGQGVLADGSDVSSTLATACTYAAGQGKVLYLPAGTYRVANVTLAGCSIVGDGMTRTVIKRVDNAAGGTTLTASAQSGFIIADLTVDGNKATETANAPDIALSNDWNFTLLRVALVNSKGSHGLQVNATADAAHSTSSQVLDSWANSNDGSGLSITGISQDFVVRGGGAGSNGQQGVTFSNAVIPPVAGSVKRPRVDSFIATGNGGSGISLSGFCGSVSSGSTCVVGYDAVTVDGGVVVNSVATGNAAYGIVAQTSNGVISGNNASNNGGTGASKAGILANATYTKIADNITNGNEFYGIDAGGCYACEIHDNTVTSNGANSSGQGVGIDVEAAQYTRVHHNYVAFNGNGTGGVQITFNRVGSSGNTLPGGAAEGWGWDGGHVQITNNHMQVASSSYYCVRVQADPQYVEIKDNSCSGNSTNTAFFLESTLIQVHGNTTDSAFTYRSNATVNSGSLIFNDQDEIVSVFSGTSGTVTGVYTNFISSYLGAAYKVVMTNRGSGYTNPTVTLPGTATAGQVYLTEDGRVANIVITNKGSGVSCSAGCAVTITDSTGVGAAATVYSDPWGALDGRTVKVLWSITGSWSLPTGARIYTSNGQTVPLTYGTQIELTGWDNSANPVWRVDTLTESSNAAALPLVSSATGITAHAGGGQSSATQLSAQYNNVATVATAADSVKLPDMTGFPSTSPFASTVARPCITVTNSGANSLQLFGTSPDTINGVATATGVPVAAGKTGQYCSPAAGVWFGGTLN